VCFQQVAGSIRTHIIFAASFLRLGGRTANRSSFADGLRRRGTVVQQEESLLP
jgi:hypothetical protein